MTLDYLPLGGKKKPFEVLHGKESCSESHFLLVCLEEKDTVGEKDLGSYCYLGYSIFPEYLSFPTF